MFNEKITIPGGKLVVCQNSNPEYPGIYVQFEIDEGDLINLVTVEGHRCNVNMYCYGEPACEGYTDKASIPIYEFYKAEGIYTKKVTHIEWDIDLEEGETYEDAVRNLELPDVVYLPKYLADADFDESISDYLTECYDYCVKNYIVEDKGEKDV